MSSSVGYNFFDVVVSVVTAQITATPRKLQLDNGRMNDHHFPQYRTRGKTEKQHNYNTTPVIRWKNCPTKRS